MESGGALAAELELRRDRSGEARLAGRFPYRSPAVLSDGGRGGRPRKKMFEAGAFNYRIQKPGEDIHLLVGHDFDHPLASKETGTLTFRDTPAALLISATITPQIAETTHGRDALALIASGLAVGLSPGFRLPPERAVPREEAESFEDEPDDGQPSPLDGQPQRRAQIRIIRQALLFEFSLVTRPACAEAAVELTRSQAEARPSGLVLVNRRWRP